MNEIRCYILEAEPLTSYTQVTGELGRAARKTKQVGKWATGELGKAARKTKQVGKWALDPERRRARMAKKAKIKKLKFQKRAEKYGTRAAISAMKAKRSKIRKRSVYNPVEEVIDVTYKVDPEKMKEFTTRKHKLAYIKHRIKQKRAKGKSQKFATKMSIRDIKRAHKSSYGLKSY